MDPVDSASPTRIGRAEIAGCAAVSVVALALIGLIWIVTGRAVQEHQASFRSAIEQTLLGQAGTFANALSHEIRLVDQSVKILQSAWNKNSDGFDLKQWQQNMPALTSVASDMFIADDKQVIQQDILPQAVGQGVGAAYSVPFNGALQQLDSNGTDDQGTLLTSGATGPGFDARQFLTYIVHPLAHPKGWIVGASYRSADLPRLFADAGLGENAIAFLVDSKAGLVLAIMGNAARQPRTNIAASQLFQVMQRAQSGTWEGDTPVDGVQRYLGFHALTDRDMILVVGIPTHEALALANVSISMSRSLAAIATVLVLIACGLVLWELYSLRTNRRRLRTFARNRSEIQRLQTEEAANIACVQSAAMRLRGVLDHTVDGFGIFDSTSRLVQWNHAFQAGIGVELRLGLPLDTIIRNQAGAGLFGSLGDPEQEIAHRVATLRTGNPIGLDHSGPNGETLQLRGCPDAAGELILTLGGFTHWEVAPIAPSNFAEPPLSTGQSTPTPACAPLEW